MKRILLGTAICVATACAASAQQSYQFVNPCDRGPVPTWKVINEHVDPFLTFLQQVRPGMPRGIAEKIAYDLCDDITLLYDNEGLTRRLSVLLQQNGY